MAVGGGCNTGLLVPDAATFFQDISIRCHTMQLFRTQEPASCPALLHDSARQLCCRVVPEPSTEQGDSALADAAGRVWVALQQQADGALQQVHCHK